MEEKDKNKQTKPLTHLSCICTTETTLRHAHSTSEEGADDDDDDDDDDEMFERDDVDLFDEKVRRGISQMFTRW